jgi:hypothetical protein
MTITRDEQRIENIVSSAIKSLFEYSASQTSASEVTEWLYENEAQIPTGIRQFIFAAAQAATTSGALK